MKEIIEGLTANLMEHIGSSRPFNKDVTGHVDPTKQLEDAKAHALNKVGCEIDLYTAGLERAMRDAQQHRPTSVNVHGPVGILQTGDYSTASMTITLDDTSKKEIVTALETVEAAIRDLQDTPFDKAELLELIRESKAEASEHQPKTTRLKGFLLGIATSIQSVAALRPAYETLKGALALIGVPLA